MKRKISNIKLFTAGLVSVALFLSACQNSGQGEKGRPAKGGDNNEVTTAKYKATADQLKHRKDILQTPLYKEHLQSLLQQLSKDATLNLENLLQAKDWFVGPLDLSKVKGELSKTVKGKEIVTKQLQHDVFVNTTAMDRLSKEEQAANMRLEFFRALYLLKNLTDVELCDSIRERFPKTEDCDDQINVARSSGDLPTSKDATKDEKKKASDSADADLEETMKAYEDEHNIESIIIDSSAESKIKELMKNVSDRGDSINQSKLKAIMKELGMDIRVFSIKISGAPTFDRKIDDKGENPEDSPTPSPVTVGSTGQISGGEVEKVFAAIESLNQQEMNCIGQGTETAQSCKLLVKREGEAGAQHLIYSVVDANGLVLFESKVYQNSKLNYSSLQGVAEGEVIQVLPLNSAQISEKVVGAKYRTTSFIISNVGGEKSIAGILSIPGEIQKVSISDKTEKETCVGVRVEAIDLQTDSVFVSVKGIHYPTLQAHANRNTPIAPCW